MIRKTTILTLSLLLFHLAAMAENWTKVESKAQAPVGGKYIITYKNDDGYYHTIYSEQWDNTGVYQFRSNRYDDKTYPDVPSLTDATTLFTIHQADGKLYLYSLADEKYISTVTSGTQTTLFMLKDEPDEACELSIERESNTLVVKIGGRYFLHETEAKDYRLRPSRKSTQDIELWRLDDGTPTELPTLDLYSDQDLTTDDFYGNIVFHREFSNDYYNTLILPFEVSDYQATFGEDVQAYELKSVSGNTITFENVDGNSLKANTFYLLKGRFSSAPYKISGAYISAADVTQEHTNKRGNITFHAQYQKKTVGGTAAYILWQQNFYQCKQLNGMTVEPYKWYLTSSSEANQLPMRIVRNTAARP